MSDSEDVASLVAVASASCQCAGVLEVLLRTSSAFQLEAESDASDARPLGEAKAQSSLHW